MAVRILVVIARQVLRVKGGNAYLPACRTAWRDKSVVRTAAEGFAENVRNLTSVSQVNAFASRIVKNGTAETMVARASAENARKATNVWKGNVSVF